MLELQYWNTSYQYKCCNIVNSKLRNKFQWNLKRNAYIYIQENPFENVCEMAAILSLPQCVKHYSYRDFIPWCKYKNHDIDGLVQDCSMFSALAMEILQSCTKPSIWLRLYSLVSTLHVLLDTIIELDINIKYLSLIFCQVCVNK